MFLCSNRLDERTNTRLIRNDILDRYPWIHGELGIAEFDKLLIRIQKTNRSLIRLLAEKPQVLEITERAIYADSDFVESPFALRLLATYYGEAGFRSVAYSKYPYQNGRALSWLAIFPATRPTPQQVHSYGLGEIGKERCFDYYSTEEPGHLPAFARQGPLNPVGECRAFPIGIREM